MANITGPALMMALQAVDEKMRRMHAEIEAADDDAPDLDYLEDLYMAYSKTAHELRVGYDEEFAKSGNLPEYKPRALDDVAREAVAYYFVPARIDGNEEPTQARPASFGKNTIGIEG